MLYVQIFQSDMHYVCVKCHASTIKLTIISPVIDVKADNNEPLVGGLNRSQEVVCQVVDDVLADL